MLSGEIIVRETVGGRNGMYVLVEYSSTAIPRNRRRGVCMTPSSTSHELMMLMFPDRTSMSSPIAWRILPLKILQAPSYMALKV